MGLFYSRLINATVLYLLSTMLHFLYSTLHILWQIAKYCFCLCMILPHKVQYNIVTTGKFGMPYNSRYVASVVSTTVTSDQKGVRSLWCITIK